MVLVDRKKNVINQNKDLEALYLLQKCPVFVGCVEHDIKRDLYADMSWGISPSNGIIQLESLIPLDILYPHQNAGSVGNIWMQHHREFAKFIYGYKPKSVLEIGGAHGVLSREYQKEDSIKWTILEPNPSPADNVNAEFIKGFFDDRFVFDDEVDAIIHSHVFEHIYYPDKFVKHLSGFLKEGQKLIFSIPNMEEMLKRNYTNCINFEHTVFLTEPYVEYLLSKFGFRQIEKQYFMDDGSIFYAYIKDKNTKIISLPDNLYEHNKKLYFDYITYHEELIHDLNKKVAQTNSNQSIYLFGAHIFAQYLIAFGLNTSRNSCLLDNNVNKQGKRLYGTALMVSSPKILADEEKPIVILKAGVYNDEIREDILTNINSSTTFFE